MNQTSSLNDIVQQALDFLVKGGALIGYILVGLIGKFGWDIINHRKFSGWYIVGTTSMAYFVGFIVWEVIKTDPRYNPGVILPLAALLSRDVMLFIIMIDWQDVLKLLTGKNSEAKAKKDE